MQIKNEKFQPQQIDTNTQDRDSETQYVNDGLQLMVYKELQDCTLYKGL